MKPICVPCQRFFRPKKTGFSFIEGMPDASGRPEGAGPAAPGKAEPSRWSPYKLWMGDRWHCPDCGAETIVGVARNPIAEEYQADFDAQVKSYGATLQVNDC